MHGLQWIELWFLNAYVATFAGLHRRNENMQSSLADETVFNPSEICGVE